jgi:hypothetical protein
MYFSVNLELFFSLKHVSEDDFLHSKWIIQNFTLAVQKSGKNHLLVMALSVRAYSDNCFVS